jgi:hypothetical protein
LIAEPLSSRHNEWGQHGWNRISNILKSWWRMIDQSFLHNYCKDIYKKCWFKLQCMAT